jgi:excinuclease UvrABC nuclease subunit
MAGSPKSMPRKKHSMRWGPKINFAGLFKNDRHETEGLIDGNGKVYPINNKSPLFFLLMRMQDEVHRFRHQLSTATNAIKRCTMKSSMRSKA